MTWPTEEQVRDVIWEEFRDVNLRGNFSIIRVARAVLALFPPEHITRSAAILEAADLIAAKDHRLDLGDDRHSTGWRHALDEAEHKLRQHALHVLDEAEGIER